MSLADLERRLRENANYLTDDAGVVWSSMVEAADLIAKLRALEPVGQVVPGWSTERRQTEGIDVFLKVDLPLGTMLYNLEGILTERQEAR